mmetsp:Transcript_60032/g.133787  ORF Transcript_60032/g.133787 Transcript_60032/m.133787 type:complete len:204 (-) Transcript_60032:122-733(-)
MPASDARAQHRRPPALQPRHQLLGDRAHAHQVLQVDGGRAGRREAPEAQAHLHQGPQRWRGDVAGELHQDAARRRLCRLPHLPGREEGRRGDALRHRAHEQHRLRVPRAPVRLQVLDQALLPWRRRFQGGVHCLPRQRQVRHAHPTPPPQGHDEGSGRVQPGALLREECDPALAHPRAQGLRAPACRARHPPLPCGSVGWGGL